MGKRKHWRYSLGKITQNDIFIENLKCSKNRVCLNCDKEFKSSGNWNRICSRCDSLLDRRIVLGISYPIHLRKEFRDYV